MHVVAPLVADHEPAAAGDPGQRTLHHPSMPAEALAALDPAPGDPGDDAALAAGAAAAAGVVGLFGGQPPPTASGAGPGVGGPRDRVGGPPQAAAGLGGCGP